MMTTEGTYPFHTGGVSTWADILVKGMPHVDFYIYAVMMNPFVTQKYFMPANVARLIKVPLWGTEEPSEHLEDRPFSDVYMAKQKTKKAIVNQEFMPIFKDFVSHLVSDGASPVEWGKDLFDLYQYFQIYDYSMSFKSVPAWEEFRRQILEQAELGRWPQPSVYELNQAMGWLYRFMVVLNTPVPRCDIVHSAAAAFCGIPAVLAKLSYKTPFLLTEHGVYLREQYLSTNRQGFSLFLKRFMMQLILSVVRLNYAYADTVSPVCEYNTRWEQRQGVNRKKIKVIYNGVDPAVFQPGAKNTSRPTVVTVARLDPLKDIETLIRAAAIVKKSIPNVHFVLYGGATSSEYQAKCEALRRELDVTETVTFAGHTENVKAAYHAGDIIALTSISEAFPYTVIEAMMSGKAVVATDVGGTREALEGCGLLVPPKDPELLAAKVVDLLANHRLREELEQVARERALTWFNIQRSVNAYFDTYRQLSRKMVPTAARDKQLIAFKRGLALMDINQTDMAIAELRQAINEEPASPAVPVILGHIAQAYFLQHRYAEAHMELQKAEVVYALLNQSA